MPNPTYHAVIERKGSYNGKVIEVDQLESSGENFEVCYKNLKTALNLYTSVLAEQRRNGIHGPGFNLITTHTHGMGKRALVIDVNDMLLEFLVPVLTDLGCGEVTYTSNFSDAKTQLKERMHEIVVSCSMFPELYGGNTKDNKWEDLHKELRRQPKSTFILFAHTRPRNLERYDNPPVHYTPKSGDLKESFRQILRPTTNST